MNPHRERAIQVAARYGVWRETIDTVRGCRAPADWTVGDWFAAIVAQDNVARHREGEELLRVKMPVDAFLDAD